MYELCNYWTLDVQKQMCLLKNGNSEKVPSEIAISGEKFCEFCTEVKKADFHCYSNGCDAIITITSGFCRSKPVTIEVLEADTRPNEAYLEVYINDEYMSECESGIDDSTPSWHRCGVYNIPSGSYLKVKLRTTYGVDARFVYNGQTYNVYGRVTYYSSDMVDLYEAAHLCPNATEMEQLVECTEVACGGHCLANSTLPDGNTNYNISNCMAGEKTYNIFIRICNGIPTMIPTRSPTSPTVSPSTSPTLAPTAHAVLFDCLESDFNITAPTIKNITTSVAVEDATVECMAAYQVYELCM